MADLKISDEALAEMDARLASLAAAGMMEPHVNRLGMAEVGSLRVADAMSGWQEIFVRAVHEVHEWVMLLRSEVTQVGDAFADTDRILAGGL